MSKKSIVENIKVMDNGAIFLEKDRTILISVSAFSTLRKDLIKNIGKERMRGFLNRYGWDLGQADAIKALNQNLPTLEETIYYGPALHMMKGHAKVKTTKLEVSERKNKYSVHMEGIWQESYEVVEHLKQFGRSDHPICYTLTGYASGYLTKICKQKVIVKEIQCQAEGYDSCVWVGKSLDYWEAEEIAYEKESYDRTPIVEELEMTYERLLEERNNLEKSSLIHKKLTEEVLQGNDLESIVKTIYETTKIPGMIVDQTHYPLAYAGISFQEVKEMNQEFTTFLEGRPTSFPIFTTKKIELAQHTRLITPIYLHREIIGYCTFIYPKKIPVDETADQMILEQISLVSSLSLLIEKTKFDTDRRIEGHFLEEILREDYKEEEILRRGLFMQIDLSEPYRIITLKYEFQENDIQKELSFHEKLLEATTNYFKSKEENVLIGHRNKSILFLLPESQISEKEIRPYFNRFLRTLSETFQTTRFLIGISKKATSITEAKESYEESLIALRMATPNKRIQFFDSIGVIGPLLNHNNQEEVRKISANLLGPLLDHNDLMETLYVYLLNGRNLEQTSQDIALSLSGLRYRLAKIEDVLGQDIKDHFYCYQLLMALQSLQLLGDIKL